MKLSLESKLAEGYRSHSQQARVLTEGWVGGQVFCPNCGHVDLDQYESGRPVADFHCVNCKEEFELKSKKSSLGNKIVDGAYRTMIERLTSSDNPNLFLLNYEPLSLVVTNFLVIPKHFFTPEIIEKRRPLSPKAERAGWVGCNILLKPIPQSGKIFFVRDGSVEPKAKVQSAWQKTLFLRQTEDVAARGWLLDVMRCIERLGKSEFALADVYGFERDLEKLHPSNRHIKDKIRQQLQILRDKNYLDFVARGLYRQTR